MAGVMASDRSKMKQAVNFIGPPFAPPITKPWGKGRELATKGAGGFMQESEGKSILAQEKRGKMGVDAGNSAGNEYLKKKEGLDFYIQPLVFLWRAREDSNPRPIA